MDVGSALLAFQCVGDQWSGGDAGCAWWWPWVWSGASRSMRRRTRLCSARTSVAGLVVRLGLAGL